MQPVNVNPSRNEQTPVHHQTPEDYVKLPDNSDRDPRKALPFTAVID